MVMYGAGYCLGGPNRYGMGQGTSVEAPDRIMLRRLRSMAMNGSFLDLTRPFHTFALLPFADNSRCHVTAVSSCVLSVWVNSL